MSARTALVPALLLALACAALLATPAVADAETLKRGSRGPAVVQLQQQLHIPADGVFGPQTARAVRRFQARKGLVVDGIVGPQTARALGLGFVEGRTAAGGRTRIPPVLARIAQCESGGNPRAVSADGTYRGKYQFSRQTWRAMGGHGDPARASEAEQDRRALALLRARGTAPWPSCAG
jgi:peptidoglycan hydrolase-like protein with peptidoglycan-binding domain